MSPTAFALAARLAALPGCWRPGMLGVPAPGSSFRGWCRILTADSDGEVFSWTDEDGFILTVADGPFRDFAALVPDLTDPATVGVLAAWCREVYGDRSLYAVCVPGEEAGGVDSWHIREPMRYGSRSISPACVATEGEAWAAAILAKLEAK